MKRLLLLAGEESGVLYARQIATEVKRLSPEVEIRGYGAYGFETHDLAVMGVWAVFKKIFYFLRVKRTMEKAIDAWKPETVCTVDYPGLNLKLAAYAKARGIRAVHVVCPQVWAWKKGRIPKIEAALDRLFCFFPFEPAIFRPGFAEFTGHPLAEAFNTEAQRRGEGGVKTLAVLPGSRMGEIEKHMPVLLKTIKQLSESLCPCGSVLKIVIPAANEKAYRAIDRHLKAFDVQPSTFSLVLQLGCAREVLRQADAAIVASGTATLEAALAGCPTVLVYRVSRVFAFFARRLIKGIKHVGLANIIAEKSGIESPMPELLQADFTSENILSFIRPWLLDEAAAQKERKKLAATMKMLESDGNSIAKIARSLI